MVITMKNIILIGFMGTGKTSTGKRLASKLGLAFVDIDQAIEKEYEMTIPEMFAKCGEDYFRTCEKQMVKRLSERKKTVIATGGGTVKDAENVKILKENGVMICLSASVDAILERTAHKGNRPVLDARDEGNRRKAVEVLMEERRELYKQADYTVDTSEWSPLQVVDDIVHYLRNRGL